MKFPTTISAEKSAAKKRAATNQSSTMVSHIRGQGLTEYIIILSLVAIAAIGATSFFGDSVKASFVALGSELTGGADYDRVAKTATSLKKADAGITGATTLKNYGD